ncbi:MAG TPA: hypothetical protein VGU66_17255 [Candidatus Elarobacter sp.]|nr:hypothetical protein [Candidatus Elarobacter sp.]
MSQPTLDNIEAGAMNALNLPEPETLPDSTAIMRNLAQVVLDLAQYIRAQEGKAAVAV